MLDDTADEKMDGEPASASTISSLIGACRKTRRGVRKAHLGALRLNIEEVGTREEAKFIEGFEGWRH